MPELYANSTYRHEFDVVDNDTDEPLDLTGATVRYYMSTERAGGDELFDLTHEADEVTVEPDDATGEVVVELPASDVPAGRNWEELRISFPDERSAVVFQSEERFSRTATEAPS